MKLEELVQRLVPVMYVCCEPRFPRTLGSVTQRFPPLQSAELHSELSYKKRKSKNTPVEQELNPLVTAYIFLTLAEERSKE